MYPSDTNKFFGIFVKNFEISLIKHGITFSAKALIVGKAKTYIEKVLKYSLFAAEILFKGIFYKYDLIYMHFLGRYSSIVYLLAKFCNKILIVNVHGSDILPEKTISARHRIYCKKTINYANLIVVPSAYYKDVINLEYEVNEDKIFVSPSGGIDPNFFAPASRRNANNFVIGYVSRIDIGKGWDDFLDALNILIFDRKMSVTAIIVGDGAERTTLLDKIQLLNLKDHVKYLGAARQEELGTIYNSMDVFAFPSKRKAESLGLVGLEAMGCGIPVVGSAIGGILSYLEDGVNGLVFEPGNPLDLADKLEEYHNLSNVSKEYLKTNALKTARRYYTDTITEKLLNRIEQCVL